MYSTALKDEEEDEATYNIYINYIFKTQPKYPNYSPHYTHCNYIPPYTYSNYSYTSPYLYTSPLLPTSTHLTPYPINTVPQSDVSYSYLPTTYYKMSYMKTIS